MRFAPYVAFFLSGASSLIFQTIWTRHLHHVFGATSVAISTVLTVFMAGLGIGNWIAGRYANRIKHPIFAYAFAELGVAIWSLLIPFLVASDGWLATVNAALRQSFGGDSGVFMIARFLCVVPILIVPTTLMGASTPLLVRHFVSSSDDPATASSKVGTLYAVNTFGAATGPLLSAFVLMPTVGLMVTNVVACAMNLSLALVIFALREPLIGSAWGSGVPISVMPAPQTADDRARAIPAATNAIIVVGALVGIACLLGSITVQEEGSSFAWTLRGVGMLGFVAVLYGMVRATTQSAAAALPSAAIDAKAEKSAEQTDTAKDHELDAGTPKAEHEIGTDAAPFSDPPSKKGKKKDKRGKSADAAETDTSSDDPSDDGLAAEREPWVPPIARKVAFYCFALSGAAALCYEVVWSRALAMTIGSSIYSFALILETFLIGIAVGSAAMSSLLGKNSRPLLGVGLTAGLLTLLGNIPWAVDMQIGTRQHHGSITTWIGVSLLPMVLLVATALYSRRRAAINETLGGRADESTLPGLVMALVPAVVALLNVTYFSTGYLPKIVTSVVVVISIFLGVTLALRRSPVLLLAVVQLFIGVATVVSYYWQDEIPYAFAQLVVSLGGDLPDHVGTVQFFMFLTAMLCTLPATLGMGAMYPLTLRVWTTGGGAIAQDVAVVYSGNTVGSIVGSWLPGFVLMPLIGMERTLHVGIVLNMLLALAMLIAGAAEPEEVPAGERVLDQLGKQAGAGRAERTQTFLDAARSQRGERRGELPMWHAVTVYILAPAIPAMLALLWLGSSRPDIRWNQTQMTLGVFRVSLAEGMLDPTSWGQPDLVYYHDGLSTTVTVERWGHHFALKNNGKVDASNGDDMPTQVTVAAYPLLMHQDGPTDLDVAIIGFGSGVTVGSTLSFPVRSVDVIELERAIPEAARFFQDVNLLDYELERFPYVQMDRLQIINDDGRNYLAATDRQYDVIISEPSNPWITGVSDLFTIDHFRIAKRRLRPGGIYCQWVQLYEMSPENIKIIFRTFAEVYQHVIVFAADDHSSDTVVLGSDAPLPLDLERLRRSWGLEVEGRMTVAAQLERADIHAPYDVFARVLLATRDEVITYAQIEDRRRGTGSDAVWEPDWGSTNTGACNPDDCIRREVPINTDDNAIIEFAAPRDLIGFERYEGYLSTIYSHQWPFARLGPQLEGFGEGDVRARNLAELAMSLVAHGRYDQAAEFIEQSQQAGRARETAVALEVLTHLLSSEREPPVRIEPPIPGPELDRESARRLVDGFDRVRDSVDQGNYGAALMAMEDIPSPLRLHSGPSMRFLYGFLLYKAASGSPSQYRAAAETLEDLVRTEEDYVLRHPEAFYFLSRSLDAEGEYDQALPFMRRYVEARLVSSRSDYADAPEPPASEAPTSDAAGEADKIEHDPLSRSADPTPTPAPPTE
ncbi:MAG: fused MFS/spermidine synthase [Deltaproteobacteria bacterium]|nr:fused MFS/spermidine synthase [Deltaproteobacteria bacterium]